MTRSQGFIGGCCSDAWAIALGLLLSLSSLSPAQAGEWPEPKASYSANSVMEAGGMRMEAKVFHDRGKERRETDMGGMKQVSISDPSAGKIYMLMPGSNMAMEMAMGSGPVPSPEAMQGQNIEAVGSETVEGLETTKYRITGTDPNGMAFETFVWATDSGIKMKMEGEAMVEGTMRSYRMYLTNVVEGPQEATLFQLPAGTQVMKGMAGSN